LREAGAWHVLAKWVRHLHDLSGRRDVVRRHFLQTIDVLEDAAQLLGVELLVAGLEGDARKLRNVADLVACERHTN